MAGNEDLISNFIDRVGFGEDAEFAKSRLMEVLALYDKLANTKVGLGTDKMTGVDAGLKSAASSLGAYDQTLQRVSQRIAQMNGQSKEFTNVLLLEAKASKELAAAKLNEAKAQTESAKQKQIAEKSSKEAIKNSAAEKKIIDDATNDYLQLSRSYTEAALRAKNYVLRLGEGHPIAVQAVKDANDIGNVLKKLDASVGQNQRNVGNYASAYNGLGISFAQVSRELPSLAINFQTFALAISNNLPMVADELGKARREIAQLKAEGKDAPSLLSKIGKSIFSWQVGLSVGITLFTLFSKQIGAFFVSLFTGSKVFDEAKEKLKSYTAALSEANKQKITNSVGDITTLELVRDILNDTAKSLKERTEAAKAFNQIADESNKLDLTQLDNLNKINDSISKQITLIEKRAFSRAAESILADKAEKLLLAQQEASIQAEKDFILERESDQAQQKQFGISEVSVNGIKINQLERYNSLLDQQSIKNKIANNENVKRAKADFDASKQALRGLIDLQGFTADSGNEDKNKDVSEQRRRALFEIEKLKLERSIETNKAIFEDEKKDFVVRLDAFKNYLDDKNKLIDLTANFEKGKKEILSEEIALIDAKQKDDKISLETEQQNTLEKLRESEMKKIQEDMKRRRSVLMFAYGEELVDAENYYDELAKIGLISFEKAKELKKQEEKLQEDFYKKVGDLAKKQVEDDDKKRKEQRDKRIKEQEDFNKRRKELEQELIRELTDLSFTFFTASIEKQKNAIQLQVDAIELRKQREIDAVNQTVSNRQQAAAEIQIIEARANAEREQLQKKQRDLDIRKAQFDKIQSIARIVQETAIAVIKLTGSLNPADKALIPLVLSISATQIAAIVAQPIPKYREGTKDHQGGRAIVGDGGKEEIVITPDGKVMKTPAKSTLVDLPKHSIVLPDANIAMNYALKGVNGLNQSKVENAPLIDGIMIAGEISSMKKAVVSAIKKQPQPVTLVENVLSRRIRRGDNSNTYLNNNLQG